MTKIEENTSKAEAVRIIVYKNKKENQWYGVALEFNLVVSGDTSQEAQYELSEAILGYVDTLHAIKGLRDFSPLNQKADEQYEQLWQALEANTKIPSPCHVSHYGIQKIHV